jgi:hypothetical protein
MENKIKNLLKIAYTHGKNDLSEKEFKIWINVIEDLDKSKEIKGYKKVKKNLNKLRNLK